MENSCQENTAWISILLHQKKLTFLFSFSTEFWKYVCTYIVGYVLPAVVIVRNLILRSGGGAVSEAVWEVGIITQGSGGVHGHSTPCIHPFFPDTESSKEAFHTSYPESCPHEYL